MIKLLIVDDEQEIREGIKLSVDWEENDILVIGEASNGTEALSIINNTFPDIVLIDIRMPEMNGLQLMEAISTTHPYIKPIILSGYEDFEYARKGIQFGAFDYLLKPCRPKDILDCILRAKSQIETENLKREILINYENDYKEFLPVIKSKYLNILMSQSHPDDSLLKKIEFLQFDIQLNNLVLAIIRFDSIDASSANKNLQDCENTKNCLTQLIKDIISKKYNCECFDANDDIIVILNIKDGDSISLDLMDEIKETASSRFNTTVSIGVSNYCKNITIINDAYKQALHAVEFKFFFGENSTVLFNNIKNQYNNNKAYPLDLEKQLLNCIKAGDEGSALNKMNIFFDALAEAENNRSFIVKSYHALLFSLYQLCIENNASVEEILEQLTGSDNTSCLSTINKLKQSISKLIILTIVRLKNNKVSNKLIENTLKFINENYNKDINLETIAKSIYITPSYMSLLFKQVVGINFVDYLHKIRLNKACELLRDPKLKGYEIAYMVGYNDDKYFSQIFKKHLGLTPTQYRENLI